ncbi:MAG: hypothetical protein PHO61_04280 [Candidatus ainarchaeum sp.]|jgi:hypothetical protein|nr:hypothetical protein [Candidatus ainarchaeum sp.]
MVLRNIFWLTKPKIVLLLIFLVILIPSYYNLSCCVGGLFCPCGFFIFNFYTAFILSYLTSSIIVEIYNVFFKKLVKKVD